MGRHRCLARPGGGKVVHDPNMNFGRADRQKMTSYAPPMRRRGRSDKQTPSGWWGAAGEFAGFALLEYLVIPVVGTAFWVVSFCLVGFEAVSVLCGYGMSALARKTRKAQK